MDLTFTAPEPTARLSAVTTSVRPHLRRKLALVGGLAVLAVPALSACGSFDYATDRPNVIANGGYDMDSNIRVNAARIVTAQPGKGVFIATFTLNPTVGAATNGTPNPSFTGLETASDAQQSVQSKSPVNIKIGSTGMVNLADPSTGGVPVTGNFKPGDIVPLTLTFSDGDKATVQVPVVTQCGPYASVVAQPQSGKAGKHPKHARGTNPQGANAQAASANASAQAASASASPTASSTTSSTGDITTDPYSCKYPPASLQK